MHEKVTNNPQPNGQKQSKMGREQTRQLTIIKTTAVLFAAKRPGHRGGQGILSENSIQIEDVREKLTHLATNELGTRLIPMLPVLNDDGTWKMWIANEGKIFPMLGQPIESSYFAKNGNDSDLHFFFYEFLVQRAFWPEIAPLTSSMMADLRNLCTSVEKLRLIHGFKNDGVEVTRMATTELEYIFLVCRSVFDILQETISKLWKRIELCDRTVEKRALPTSFRKMLLPDGVVISATEMTSRFGIPLSLAKVYLAYSEFFVWLRQYRDFVVHGGTSIVHIFNMDDGFAVSTDREPFSSMNIWGESNTRQNNLGSMRSAMAHLILTTFQATENLLLELARTIEFAPLIAPEWNVYICGHYIHVLADLEKSISINPWYES